VHNCVASVCCAGVKRDMELASPAGRAVVASDDGGAVVQVAATLASVCKNLHSSPFLHLPSA